MKNLKKRFMSAVLASIKFVNVGMNSYAMMPSDLEITSEETGDQWVYAISADEMEGLPVNDLFEYLKIKSTDDELRLYYQDGTLDKTRQDIESFDLLSKEKKNELFDYVAGLAYGDELEGFTELPMKIKTEFFEFILKENYDLEPILLILLVDKGVVYVDNLKIFVNGVCNMMVPRVAGLVFGKLNKDKNLAIDAITESDLEKLTSLNVADDYDYDADTKLGCKLIEYAALTGDVQALKYLLLQKVEIPQDIKVCALMSGNLEMIRLAEENSGSYSEVLNNSSVIYGLISGNEKDILVWLQTNFGDITNENIFINWCRIGDVSFLIDWLREICPEEEFSRAIQTKDSSLREEMIKLFFENGADVDAVNKNGWTALMVAAGIRCADLVQILLSNGADVNISDKNEVTALMFAADGGYTDIVQILLENGADVNIADKNKITVLMAVAYKGHIDVIQLLLKNGAEVDAVDKNGTTALMVAASVGRADISEILIASGADVNKANNDGGTALMAAAYGGYVELVQLLIKNGVDVNAGNKNEVTALMYSANEWNADLAQALIESGADVNAADCDGTTVLMLAIEKENLEFARMLLENGADVNAADKNGVTALNIATQRGHSDLINFLKVNGAER